MPTTTPTAELFDAYQAMFAHFNRELFHGDLPGVVLNFSRRTNAHGFFAPDRWAQAVGEATAHEISLNPESTRRAPEEVASTLVHEMVHLWQQVRGKPSRTGYHNKEWAAKMRDVGLPPVSLDQPGRDVGQKVTHEIDPDGAFLQSFKSLPKNALPWTCAAEQGKEKKSQKNKVKYECECGTAAWGKPGLNLVCGDCELTMSEV